MYGTHSITDLLAVTNQSIAQFGEGSVAEAFAAELTAHNGLVANMLQELTSFGDEQITMYGGSSDIVAVDTDEFGRSDAQKPATGVNVGFPLRNWDVTLQWTRLYMETHTPADAAKTLDAAKVADLKAIQRAIRRALYTPTNNLTFVDRRSNNMAVLPVRALLNADSGAVPVGPNGETFDGATHTHYLATASLVAANVSALIATVTEHEAGGEVRLYINAADEAAIRAMTSNFTPYFDSRITPANNVAAGNAALNVQNTNNRAIGIFNNAEVWVKPWVLASYLVAMRVGSSIKPLRARTRTGSLTGLGEFALRFEHEHYPLRSETMSREIGFGVHNRAAAAVLYTGGGAYSAPASF